MLRGFQYDPHACKTSAEDADIFVWVCSLDEPHLHMAAFLPHYILDVKGDGTSILDVNTPAVLAAVLEHQHN